MVRTRFAPSPTGYLHIGGVRTALFNWLFARRHDGHFILRIDDTDQRRNVAEALQPILDGFRWLGIDWDEGPGVEGPHAPYYQSQRQVRYQEAAEVLLANGYAYRDYARSEEVQAEREAAEQAKQRFVYSRKYMAETDRQAAQFEAEGREAVVRLKTPREGTCRFTDLVRGQVEVQWQEEPDHVVQRADGSCLYHLASVVDDHDFEISHVIRAVEHLSNTPRQILVAQGLGYELPQFAHLPYVAEPGSKNKLSKRKIDKYLKNRDFQTLYQKGEKIATRIGLEVSAETFNPVLVDFYREIGFLPEAVVNYLLLLGWSLDDRTEEFNREEMIQSFSLERVNRAPASFDPAKLEAFQQRRMLQYPMKKKVALVLPFLQKAGIVPTPAPCEISDKLTRILQAAGDRLKVAGDILDYDEFFVSDDAMCFDEKAFQKRIAQGDAGERLEKFRGILEQVEPFQAEVLEKTLKNFVAAEEIKIGQIIHALRVAVTGKAVGIGMFETLEILERNSCLRRIDRALAKARGEPSPPEDVS